MKLKNKSSLGNTLWERSKKLIPGGNMFLSKRPERFLPGKWPTYYKKSKGCYVYDLKNKKYVDMIMGIGTNILGYSHPAINRSVIKAVKNGTMATLNSLEEQMLAKELIKMHKWAGLAKFARTGGEANAIAIRIARAFNKKYKIAICGYHGWHDWYLSTNLNNEKNLNDHLLPGLKPEGVPKILKNSVFTFSYNNFEQLLNITKKHNLSAIMMEVSRNYHPKNNFLKKIRKLANKKKIILIFDECTSGFRQTFGGLHKYFKVNPDITIFGKSLGNGHPITAIIGRRKIMNSTQLSFISSTFWSERVGYVAALETLKQMKKYKSWKKITHTGNEIKKHWKFLSKKHNLNLKIIGIPAICSFDFESKYSRQYITYITQEMLRNGYLANNSVYVCIMHNKNILKKYYFILDKCFKNIKKCENKKLKIKELLKSPSSIQGFVRLN